MLIVDDDDVLRETLGDLVESEGYRSALAENGSVALDRLRSDDHPSLIVLDLMMPVMSGQDFRAAQLADPKIAPIPVVVLSAAHDARQVCAELGALDCFSKPIDLDRFLAVVRKVCGPP